MRVGGLRGGDVALMALRVGFSKSALSRKWEAIAAVQGKWVMKT
jgi:hypothetical protein